MDRTQLLQHFDTLAETPEAVEKLRKLVLDFAIRGRLVPQNPKDDPARQLVERAKAVLVEGRKKTNGHNNGEQAVPPFILPKNWYWTCLDELGDTAPKNELDDKTEVRFSPMRLVNAKFGEPISFERKAWGEVRKGFTHFADGDVVVAKITPCFQNGKSGVIRGAPNGFGAGTTELHVLRPVADCVLPDYALVFLKSAHFLINGEAHMTGTAGQKRVSWDYFARTQFPLPPLPEQRRIVAKVEELLVLCDALEARQTGARQNRTRLVRSALDHLTTAPTPDAFRRHAAFFQSQFPQLTFTPDAVSALRKAVLQLAVQGHLTNKVQSGTEKQGYWMIPANWRWVRVEDAGRVQLGRQRAPQYHTGPNMRPYLRVQNVYEARLDLSDVKHMEFSASDYDKYRLESGDILLNEGQSAELVGRPAIYRGEVPGACFQNTLVRFQAKETVATEYALVVFRAYMHGARFTGKSVQTTNIAHLGAGRFSQMFFPLPPLAEQQRIVAKVDELLRWCDALEAQLTAAQTTATHLFDATLYQILTA